MYAIKFHIYPQIQRGRVEKYARNSHRLNYMMLHGLYFDM